MSFQGSPWSNKSGSRSKPNMTTTWPWSGKPLKINKTTSIFWIRGRIIRNNWISCFSGNNFGTRATCSRSRLCWTTKLSWKSGLEVRNDFCRNWKRSRTWPMTDSWTKFDNGIKMNSIWVTRSVRFPTTRLLFWRLSMCLRFYFCSFTFTLTRNNEWSKKHKVFSIPMNSLSEWRINWKPLTFRFKN